MRILDSKSGVSSAPARGRATLRGHIKIARVDHWVKNVFVLPGIVVAISIDRSTLTPILPWHIVIGLLSVCLVTSSNYVINEVLDARFDREHPGKRDRPVPSGQVNIRLAYLEWFALMLVGIGLGFVVSVPFALVLCGLWLMSCVYNIPPIRSKDVPYIDVLSESINNPLRMLAGWYITNTKALPPASLLVSYWMIGCYFMAIKRFAEYRELDDAARSTAYRKSFAYYDERRLLVSIVFYASQAMLFFGAFIMRYRLELILSFPLVALVMAIYLSLAFKQDSAVQRPEGLYREPRLMAAVISCALLMVLLLFVDVPILYRIFLPSAP